MDIVGMHERALDQTGRIVAGVTVEQLELPTPCGEWDVRTVIGHLVRGNENNATVAEGGTRNPNPIADVGDDPVGAYRASVEAVRRAWRDPARLQQTYQTPLGPMSGSGLLTLRLADNLTHGWDLARATGQNPQYDDEIVQVALRFVQGKLPAERAPGGPFAPAVPVSEDLPPIDRLAAATGRQP